MKNLLNSNRYSNISRFLRLTLCVLLIAMLIMPFAQNASNGVSPITVDSNSLTGTNTSLINGAASSTALSSTTVNGINIDLKQSLKNNGDGTYTIELTPQTSFSIKDYSEDHNAAKCGYFKANKDGNYIFEIWGGNGGTGENTKKSNGGTGGKGGYLTAQLSLKAGDIIFYTIGGNGQQTVSPSYGGGANGDGGDHGESGHYMIGGGGGFTAVYYFSKGANANTFSYKYLDGTSLKVSNLDEADRTTKYIMIAGGGGGGGAGNSISSAVRTPDGGNAGSMTSASGHLTDALVPGTYYAGENGKSSGDKQDYIGIGGSNIPGEEKSTKYSWFEGKVANDWNRTANPEAEGGTGGAGNLRGGAGGAGYCGGSGGVMTSLVSGTNVGGGGGGSSFLSDEVSIVESKYDSYLSGANASATGGAVYITCIPDAGDLDIVTGLTATGTISDYFDIVSVSASEYASASFTGKKFTVTKVNALNVSETVKMTTISIVVQPTTDFMGGNDVPLFKANEIYFTLSKTVGVISNYSIGLENGSAYVNVPYNFDITTYEKTLSTTLTSVAPTDLYSTLTDTYEFISFKNYIVKDNANNTISTSQAPKATTVYTVYYTASPTNPSTKASVGDELAEKTFSKTAKIINNTTPTINGNNVTYTKSLDYDNSSNTYSYSVQVDSTITNPIGNVLVKSNTAATTLSENGNFKAPATGYYLIQAWGAKGARGGDCDADMSGMDKYSGGEGANGGYVYSVIYLKKDETLSAVVGVESDQPKKTSGINKENSGGTGGTYSAVTITSGTQNGQVVLVAAGGGGGGGAAKSGATSGADGAKASPTSTVNSVSSITLSTDYNGKDGGKGNHSSKTGGSAGSSPASAKNSTVNKGFYSGISTTSEDLITAASNVTIVTVARSSHDSNHKSLDVTDASTITPASVVITPLDVETTQLQVKGDYTLEFNFTEYFDINTQNIAYTGITSHDAASISSNVVTIGNITPTNAGDYDYPSVTSKDISFTITIPITPKTDFIGGYDVLLIKGITLSQTDSDSNTSNDSVQLAAKESTDYVNVKLNKKFIEDTTYNKLEGHTIKYHVGSTGINKTDLYTITSNYVLGDTSGLEYYVVEYKDDINTPIEDVLSPTKTTQYTIRYGIRPIEVSSTKASVVTKDKITPIYVEKTAEITAYYFDVAYNLTDVSATGGSIANIEDGYVTELSTTSDKVVLLGSIKIGEAEYKGYTYNESTGKLTIPGSAISGPITIAAGAKDKDIKYNIYYGYSKNLDGTDSDVAIYKDLKAGDDISSIVPELLAKYNPTGITGYDYVVEYPNGDILTYPNVSDSLTKMPAENVWLFAYYTPKTYTLTINYKKVSDNGDNAADPVILNNKSADTACYYGMTYNITSPNVDGYVPNKTFVSGTVTEDSTINVIYTELDSNKVLVTTVYADGFKDPVQETITKSSGKITITLEEVTGYTYTKSESFDSGVAFEPKSTSITITYTPTEYDLTFDAGTDAKVSVGSGTISSTGTRKMYAGHKYGYTSTTGYANATYEPFPTPVKNGWVFDGWYYESTSTLASEEDVLLKEGASNKTLEAKWIPYELTSDYVIIGAIADQTYSGEEKTPSFTVKWDLTEITWKTDDTIPSTYYSVTYENNVNVLDTPVVTITFNGYKFSGTFNTTFAITQATNNITSLTLADWKYGSPNTPSVDAKYGASEATYEYSKNESSGYSSTVPTDVGTYYVKATIPATSNYTSATKTESFKITAKKISSSDLIVEYTPKDGFTYDGNNHKPTTITVKDGDKVLEENKDYKITYDNDKTPPEGQFTIEFIGNYEETDDEVVKYPINQADLSSDKDLTITLDPTSYTYDGTAKKPKVAVTHKNAQFTFEKDTDYTVTYEDNINVGTAKAIITFKGSYTGSVTKKFTIESKGLSGDGDLTISLGAYEKVYDGTAKTPVVTITHKDLGTLKENTDFTVIYANNIEAGTATATINYKGNYNGSIVKDFTIDPVSLDSKITISNVDDQTYTGSEITPKPSVTITASSKTLTLNTHYTLSYENNINVGTATITVTFKGNYSGTGTKEFDIVAKSLTSSNIEISSIANQTYTGSEITPEPTIKLKNTTVTLEKGTDYTLDYKNTNTNVGEATITITFKGNYSGSDTVKFNIVKANASISVNQTTIVLTYGETLTLPTATTNFGSVSCDKTEDDLKNAGTYTVTYTVAETTNYNGDSKSLTVIIKSKKINNPQITITPDEPIYNGDELEPEIEVKDDDGNILEKDKDYIVKYEDNEKPPKGRVIIEFINNYEDTDDKEKEFTINQKNLGDNDVTISDVADQTYTGSEIKPEPVVTIKGSNPVVTLVKGTDYTLSYTDNINVGEATITVTFKGNYSGSTSANFDIVKANASISVNQTTINLTYGDTLTLPTATTNFGSVSCDKTEDDLKNAGTYTVTYTVAETTNYNGDSKSLTVIIKSKKINNPQITIDPEESTYNGDEQEPKIEVKDDDGNPLEKDKDYIVKYEDNEKPPKGRVIIEFINNYEDTDDKEKEFTINQKNLGDNDVIISDVADQTYTGSAITPEPTITIKNSDPVVTLVKDTDYTLSYKDNINVGTATITVTFKGNYSGSATKEFEIVAKSLSSSDIEIGSIADQTYTGSAITPTIVISTGSTLLKKDTDYTLSYSNNINVAKSTDTNAPTVTITFKGNYSGTEEVKFTILPKKLYNPTITITPEEPIYNGDELEPEIEVKDDDGNKLEENKDYIVKFEDNEKPPKGKVIIEFINNYKDTDDKEKEFTIKPKALTEDDVTIKDVEDQTYTGKEVQPEPVVTIKGSNPVITLVKDTDYTLSYKDNINVGIATIYVTFEGNYSGSATAIFIIASKKINNPIITIIPEESTYDNENEQEPKVEIKDEDGNKLEEGKDYIVKYKDNKKPPKGKVIIEFINNYEETENIKKEFTINPKTLSISDLDISTIKDYIYTGSLIAPEPTISLKNTNPVITLVKDTDYILSYRDNVKVGTATTVITFKGNYSGSAKVYFNILKKDINPSKTDETGTVTIETEDGVPVDIEIYVELKVSAEGKDTGSGNKLSLESELGFGEAFGDVYEIKIMRDGVEIQPDEIEPGTVLKVKMKVPENLVGKNFRILHIHNNDDISYITRGSYAGIGTYIIDEEGNIVTMVNKFSEFAFVYNVDCISHWFLLTFLILFIAFVVVYLLVLVKKIANEKTKVLLPLIVCAVFALATIITALTGTCYYCIILTIINGFALLVSLFVFGYLYFKKHPLIGKLVSSQDDQPTEKKDVEDYAELVKKVAEKLLLDSAKAEVQKEKPVIEEEKPVVEEPVVEVFPQEEPVAEETQVEEVPQEEPITEEAPQEEPSKEEEELEDQGATLKESIALAAVTVQAEDATLSMSKQAVVDYLSANYKDTEVELNHRVNYTKTGLPLADTHYDLQQDKHTCFTYVYELEDGKVFFLIRTTKDKAAKIKEVHPSLISSAFPKSPAKDWYTLVLDDSYKTNQDVFNVLDLVLGKDVDLTAAPSVDNKDDGLSLKESIKLAKEEVAQPKEELNMSKKVVCEYLNANYKDAVEINTRVNYTITGLPLADTHYDLQNNNKVCFTYVYELEDGKVFFLIRTNKDNAAKIKKSHPAFASSAFPKSPAKDWYTMVLDNSFNSNQDVFNVLDLVLGKNVDLDNKEEKEEGLTLKESIKLAKEDVSQPKEELNISKKAVCEYLAANYKDTVEINTRVNYTKTGLPLADTHYDLKDGGKVCFTYVYELEDGKVFFLLRTNKDTASKIKNIHNGLTSSAFPKSPAKDWYTIIIDNSFACNKDVFDVLDMVLGKDVELSTNSQDEGLSLKESIKLAKEEVAQPKEELSMSKKAVCEYLEKNYSGKVEINTRVNYTVTGLPLADTHYDLQPEKKVCFTYVYELEDGKVFFLIRANKETAKEIKKQHKGFTSSAFPKSPAKDWYTMVLDDSFECNKDVFDVLDLVLSHDGPVKPLEEKPKKETAKEEKAPETKDEGVSLKESIELAKNEESVQPELNMSKKVVYDYLAKNYKGNVELNTRENYTKTGLPLADTHFDLKFRKRKCFTYVYELEDGKVFFLIRTNDETAEKIKKKHNGLVSSAFPKSPDNDWYTMILDSTFKSNEDVFEVLDLVLSSNKFEKTLIEQLIDSLAASGSTVNDEVAPVEQTPVNEVKEEIKPSEDVETKEEVKEEIVEEQPVVEEPIYEETNSDEVEAKDEPIAEEEPIKEEEVVEETPVEEPVVEEAPIVQPAHEIIKEEVSVTEAQEIFKDEDIVAIVQSDSVNEERYSVQGKEECVNIDTLSKVFNNGDIVDIKALKAKKLVSKNAQRVKILARGKLNKSLTVYADNYSTDAAKMIVACGGKLIALKK